MQAGKEEKVLAKNALNDKILASPVASDGAIFLRSDTNLGHANKLPANDFLRLKAEWPIMDGPVHHRLGS